jgi:RNA polymerase sigma-70 factor, ECF subfamily
VDETRKGLRSENDVPRKIEQRAQTMLQYVNSRKEERNKRPVIGQSQAPGDNGLFHDGQTLDDERLVGAAKIGHKAAFDELSRRHAKKIFHIAHRITRNREDAEDVVQESFVQALIHLKSFDGRSQFSTWLTRIAINSALMSLRKNRRSLQVPLEERIEPSEPWHEQFAVPDPSLNPEERFAKHECETILRRSISRLRPRMREVVEIHLQEYSLNDTANALGISLPAAKGRLFHARGVLRRAMNRSGSD